MATYIYDNTAYFNIGARGVPYKLKKGLGLMH